MKKLKYLVLAVCVLGLYKGYSIISGSAGLSNTTASSTTTVVQGVNIYSYAHNPSHASTMVSSIPAA